ncbi:transmembrane protein [Citrus sinensis]|uniref:Transmembrane protein n=1 Tax=Citrus sinensis TaxID=2711 RepID=A0ACB8LS20_CITSI|nr:transmembrane protein [Citrus sinensis]
MNLKSFTWYVLQCWVLSLLFFKVHGDSVVSVKFLKAPKLFSRLNSATFLFQVLVAGNYNCTDCRISCKLDDGIASDCGTWEVSYTGLHDGNHTFEVCGYGSQGVGCSSHNWIVDTVPPTAYITASSSFTNAKNVSVNISFTEPCSSRGGFGCSSVNACNLLVYGAGQVIPSSLITVQRSLEYSLLVSLSSNVQYGRVILVMDKSFCTDSAGNIFSRAENSSFYVHFDRRSLFVDLRSHVPEKLLQLNNKTRTVQATNDDEKLKVYLYFSEAVLNSSAEILNSLNSSQGTLVPINGKNRGNHRFGFMVANISSIAIITVSLKSNSIISRYGTPVLPIDPVTFLYDSQRPAVRLSTTSSTRTRQDSIPILIKFLKPVFGFNSSLISISGGHLQSFQEIRRSIYILEIQANADTVSVNVPENVTGDVAGNKNLPSNVLQVKHYSVPTISSAISTFVTAAFVATSVAAGLLTVATSSLLSVGAFLKPPYSLVSDPARNLFRTACHIQVFALSRWLADTLPVEYYEFARGIQWSIPYFNLPWETGQSHPVMVGSSSPDGPHSYISKFNHLAVFQSEQPVAGNSNSDAAVYGSPLTPMEYESFFESQNIKPEADYLDSNHMNGWREFDRSMFWLAVIGGSLILLHILLVLIVKFRKKNSEKQRGYGAVTFPRFEIFLIILALPCICKDSAALVEGGARSGLILGILLLAVVSFLLLSLLLFLSVGITLGKLLQYKEVHQEGQRFHWYQEIVRVTLGPGKRGQWTWKNQPDSSYLTILGPLFEDLRGPPKYMLSQISGGNPHKERDRIIASDDETEDAEAPFIQKLFGILRIYYTLLESVKRVSLGILAGVYTDDWSSKTPTIVLLCITSFQLFFMVLKKPFIKKKIQLVEIISISCQVGLFTLCLVFIEKEFSSGGETKVGISMLALFLVGYFAQMINEWYALYRQVKQLDPTTKSLLSGLKVASFGVLLLVFPQKLTRNLESNFPLDRCGEGVAVDTGSADRIRSSGSRSSGSTDKPWLKQLREMAKSSFSKERSGTINDPSTSQTKWNGFWSAKRSRSSSSSSDFKSKSKGLYKDLEAIFAAK